MSGRKLHTELMRTIHRFRRFNMSAVFGGLSRGEFFVLEVLAQQNQGIEGQGVYVSELAEKLEVSTPAVSRMLRGMESKGWIERVTEQSDRRNTRVLMTREGADARTQTEGKLHLFSDNVVEQMGDDELEELLLLWNRLLDAMEGECENLKKRNDKTDA